MPQSRSASPIVFLFLVLPFGIGLGFTSVTLPYVLVHAGVSVEASAAVVAASTLPNTWRFAFGPITDLTLSLRRWYLLSSVGVAAAMMLLALTPMRPGRLALVTALAVLLSVAINVNATPVGGLMAHTVAEDWKGRAAGWYQAGNLGGMGLGGGAGVWLTIHATLPIGGLVLAAASLACAAAVFFVPDVSSVGGGAQLRARLREMGRDFRDLLGSSEARLVTVLVASPIGAGAAAGLWSAVAGDWHASANLVALTTGALSGLVSAAGCVAGGWLADRAGRWWAYFGSGVVLALVAGAMALAARVPGTYAAGVLGYAAVQGICNAAFSALVLHAIGRGAASTKYAVLSPSATCPSPT